MSAPGDSIMPPRTVGAPDAQILTDMMVVLVTAMDHGVVNEECEEGEQKPCEDGCGTERCEAGTWNRICEASPETCNGHDDNCNGQVDENFATAGLGAPCTATLENGCDVIGVAICNADGSNIECDAMPIAPELEQCDGTDNDCDGSVDEGFELENCCADAVQCPLGHICENNRCEDPNTTSGGGALTPCASAANCTSLEECISGFCRPLCLSDSDCDTGYDCTCPVGESCAFEVCVPEEESSGRCNSNQECNNGQRCSNGVCINNGNGCVDNFDCPSGQSCDLEQGMCINTSGPTEPECRANSECPVGYNCSVQGQCVRSGGGGQGCFFNEECPLGYFCDINSGQCISLYANAPFCNQLTELTGTGTHNDILSIGARNLVVPRCGYHYIDGVLPAEVSDKMFKWTAPFNGSFVVDTIGSTFDTVLAAYDRCGLNARELACNDDINFPFSEESRLEFAMAQNEVIYLGVSGMDPFASGAFVLNYYAKCIETADCDVGQMCTDARCVEGMSEPVGCVDAEDCENDLVCIDGACAEEVTAPGCQSNEDCVEGEACIDQTCVLTETTVNMCDGAITVPIDGQVSGSTVDGRQFVEPPCVPLTGNPGKDVVFAWRPTQSDNYDIRVEGSHPNPILSVYNNCEPDRLLLNCDNDSGDGLNPKIRMFGTAFTTYYVVVSSASELFDGTFSLVIEPVMPDAQEPQCTFSNNRECGESLVCLNGQCVQATDTNLCSRAELLIGGNRQSDRCVYPQLVEGRLERDDINDCTDDGYEGFDAHWRWQPCRPGRYRLTAIPSMEGMDISLALYTECNTNRTYEIACKDEWSDADETVEVEVGPNYFVANDPYGLFQEIVVSGRNESASGNVQINIECLEGDCLN